MDPLKILAIEHDSEYEIIDKTLREMLEGGSYGQVLTKNSDTNFDAPWTNLEGTAVVTGVRNSSYITVSNLNGLTANSIYSLFNSGKNLYIRFDAGKRIELLSAIINSTDLNITVN